MNRARAHRPKRYAWMGLFLVILLITSSAFAHNDKKQERKRDLIVVIDVSTSMLEIMDKAKAEAKQFISSAQVGDRVTIITFGESAHLLDRARIKSSYDIARILWRVDELEATEFATNLPSAMARGLEEMRQFYKEDPKAQRVMMWLSDEKNNPPEDVTNVITFETLKQRETARLPDKKWFDFEAPIKPETESDLDWFVNWAIRTDMQLKVELITTNFGALSAAEPETEIGIHFEPDTPSVWGTTFSVVAEIIEKDGGSYSATVPVTPPVVVCRGEPWDEIFTVSLPARPGNYKCRISFVLPSDKMLKILPPQVAMVGRIKPDPNEQEEEELTIADAVPKTDDKTLRDYHTKAAYTRRMRADFMDAAKSEARKRKIIFGPIVAGGEYRQIFSLIAPKDVPLDSIYMKTYFKLPDGIELHPHFKFADDGTLMAEINLVAGDSPALADDWEVAGSISFLSSEEGVGISPSHIPARLYGKQKRTRWGRPVLRRGATYSSVDGFFSVVGAYALVGAKALPVVLLFGLVYYGGKKYFFGATELVGSLEIVKAPRGAKKNTFNLRRMGRRKSRDSLVIGSNGKSDILLPHRSVAGMHARISTAKTNAGAVVLVLPLNRNQIVVNGVAYAYQKEIGNGDIMSIGGFVLTYKCPQLYRETVVEFADGRRIRGMLITWDIDAPSFEFLPQGAPSPDAKMVVEFSELKSVAFIRKEGWFSGLPFLRSRKPANGRPLEVIFEDGDLLEGYMVGEENEWSKRFYLIPKERGEVVLMLIERSAVQVVESGYAFGT